MSKKKGNNNTENEQKKNKTDAGEGKKKENSGGGSGGDNGGNVVVLKMDLHCKGCAAKVVKCVKYIDGVVSVKGGENGDLKKLTVAGKVDPSKLREKLEKKTKKKVEIISPALIKKDKEDNNKEKKINAKNKDCNEAEEKNNKNKQKSDHDSNNNKAVKQIDEKNKNNTKAEDKNVKKGDEKKSKETPVTTILLKVNWHCQGCIRKIEQVVTKTKGYVEMSIDRNKNLLMVKGSMDPKVLVESLHKRLKKSVEIVQAKKEAGGEKGKSGEKVKNGGDSGGGSKRNDDGDGELKAGGGGGGKGGNSKEGLSKLEVQKTENVQIEYPYPLVYGSGYLVEYIHAPQLFSDENPNACVVM